MSHTPPKTNAEHPAGPWPADGSRVFSGSDNPEMRRKESGNLPQQPEGNPVRNDQPFKNLKG